MKNAVVYYSLTGNTDLTAKKISEALGAKLIRIKPVKDYPDSGAKKFLWGGKSAVMKDEPELLPYSFNAGEYDRVIFGTPVWASTFTPPIRTFINENRDALKGKRIALFTCFSGGGAEKAINKLMKYLEIDSIDSKLILIDPKDKPDPANDEKTEAFISSLKD